MLRETAMKTNFLGVLACLFLSVFVGASSVAQAFDEVTRSIELSVERDQIRAAVLARFDQGETVIRFFGSLGDNRDSKPNAQTLFEIGSITKVFTVILTQVLVDEGKLEWNDPISKHLDNIDFSSADVAAITLRQLGTHTSGLPRLADNMQPKDSLNPYADYDKSSLFEFLSTYTPDALEKKYSYSNLGMGLLGFIAGNAIDMDYASALAKYVLQPLGMDGTTATIENLGTENIAQGFSDGANMPHWTFQAVAGAGAMLSSGRDLLRFVEVACTEDREGLAKAIHATQMFETEGSTGLAWSITQAADGTRVFSHGGGTGGFASFLAVSPMTRQGWVILAASTAYGQVSDLGMTLIGHAKKVEMDLAPYVGVYQLDANVYLTVTDNDGKLFAQASGQPAFPLTPSETAHIFKFNAAQINVEFVVDESNRANALQFAQAGQQITAKRVANELGVQKREEITIPSERLEDYIGEYQLAPGLIITVENRSDQLFVALTRQPSMPVFPMTMNRFFYKAVDAEISFLRDDDGKVTTLVLHQNGEHRAPRKN